MAFIEYISTPHLFKVYHDGPTQELYEPVGAEICGDLMILMLTIMWNIAFYASPLIFILLYRRGHFVAKSIPLFAKICATIVFIVATSLCIRSIGRSSSINYTNFVKALDAAKANVSSKSAKDHLRMFDFEFYAWPVDFSINEVPGVHENHQDVVSSASDSQAAEISTLPRRMAAYVFVHSIGIHILYPGTTQLLQMIMHTNLVKGRAKLIENEQAVRYKVRTIDDNDIDTIFIDNRGRTTADQSNGRTLVMCSDGNGGFYETGIMATPIALKYSVLGWNHPGFAGSTGTPYPNQEQNAIDAVMQFAIHKLGFQPENILLFGWSIGGYSTLVAAAQYPDVRGVVLDATFDDLWKLVVPRTPSIISGIMDVAIRQYANLNNTDLISHYDGPVLLIRRTDDEVIAESNVLQTNRGNHLLVHLLKTRFPNIFQHDQVKRLNRTLSQPLNKSKSSKANDELSYSLLLSYLSENSMQYPLDIGANYTAEQRNHMADYLLQKHMIDYNSTHNTPLPAKYFRLPWAPANHLKL